MNMQTFLILLAGQVVGYLIGGIPFAYLVVRWRTGQDIRTIGSGNVGATNAGRLLGFQYFILVFLLDFAKGALPVLAAKALSDSGRLSGADYLPEVVGFATILGHLFPIYLGMKGGKGVATTIGVLLCLVPYATLAGLAAWVVLVLVTRMVSVGSLAFAVAFAVVYLFSAESPWAASEIALTGIVILLAVMIILKHRTNIRRVIEGTEPRIRFRRSRGDSEA